MPDAFPSGSSPMGPHGNATTADGETASGYTAISRAAEKWFHKRGIHHGALRVGGVYSEVRGGSEAIVFPYRRRGTIVNRKYRAEGKRLWMDTGGELILWNLDCLLSNPDHVYIVEGEPDALAFMEAGIWNVVSVPNGAAPPVEDGDRGVPEPDRDDAFRYLWNCRDELAGKRFVLAGDTDAPGVHLRHSLVARLGRANCDVVDWPEGVKDGNDYLIEVGPEAFAEYVRASRKPYPIRGLWAWNEVQPTPPMETLDIGIPLLRQHVRLARGTVSVVTGIPNHGKALDIDTPIPTPSGWTTMGALQPGDQVFDEKGKPCRVVAATPVMHDRPCHRMRFSGGAEIVADAAHEWATVSEAARRRARTTSTNARLSISTTAEIAASLKSQGKNNHQIPLCRPLELPEAALPIEPYVLGVWLGNGTTASSGLTQFDLAVITGIREAGYGVNERARAGSFWIVGLNPLLRALGLLGDKHIPAIYLRASAPQRLALLQGLMDTDGYCHPENGCEFTSVKRALAEGAYELALSLGIRARWSEGRATIDGRDCGPKYRVLFSTDVPVFRLERKLARQKIGRHTKVGAWTVTACDPVDSVPVRCIQVDSPSSLFLAGRQMIPTHNSALWKQIACQMIKLHGWNVTAASFEDRVYANLMPELLRIMSGLGPSLEPWVVAARAEAALVLAKHMSFIADEGYVDEPMTLKWLVDIARDAKIRYGTAFLIFDPWNEIEHLWGRDQNETQYIGEALRDLRRLAVELDMHIMIVAHPTKVLDGQAPGLYHISGSAHWANKVDIGLVVHQPHFAQGPGGPTEIYVRKIKRAELGQRGIVTVQFNPATASFEAPAGRPFDDPDVERTAA